MIKMTLNDLVLFAKKDFVRIISSDHFVNGEKQLL